MEWNGHAKDDLIKPADPDHPRSGYVPYWV